MSAPTRVSESSVSRFVRRIRSAFRSPLPEYRAYQQLFAGRSGLEIGGPSKLFRRDLPIYRVMDGLDGVNFAAHTVWEGALSEDRPFTWFAGRGGRQFIGEASDLGRITPASYDFVLSCNNLEHLANPLRALAEWQRVVRPGGHILLVLPRKESNFDHRRAVTPFAHLRDDLQRGTDEHDLSHLDEIVRLHDQSMDAASGDADAFLARSRKNFENRCLHHHVFDMALIDQVFAHAALPVLLRTTTVTDYIAVARKP